MVATMHRKRMRRQPEQRGGGSMGATAAKEVASEWIRMDGEGSGERTRVAREAAPRGQWGNGTCCGDRGNGNDCGMKKGDCTGMIYRRYLLQREGRMEVSMCPRARIPFAYTPNSTLPLGPRGDHRDPRTGRLSTCRHAGRRNQPVGVRTGDGQKTWCKRMQRDENAASRWAVACEYAGSTSRGKIGGKRDVR